MPRPLPRLSKANLRKRKGKRISRRSVARVAAERFFMRAVSCMVGALGFRITRVAIGAELLILR